MSQRNQLITNYDPFTLKFLFLIFQTVKFGVGKGAPAVSVLLYTVGTPSIALMDYADAVRFKALRIESHGRNPKDFDLGSKVTALFSFRKRTKLRHN